MKTYLIYSKGIFFVKGNMLYHNIIMKQTENEKANFIRVLSNEQMQVGK